MRWARRHRRPRPSRRRSRAAAAGAYRGRVFRPVFAIFRPRKPPINLRSKLSALIARNPTFAKWLLLSVLLHVWLVALLGNADEGAGPRGLRMQKGATGFTASLNPIAKGKADATATTTGSPSNPKTAAAAPEPKAEKRARKSAKKSSRSKAAQAPTLPPTPPPNPPPPNRRHPTATHTATRPTAGAPACQYRPGHDCD